MPILDTLLDHNTMLEQWVLCTVEDIPDEQWADQPAGLTNHPAWVLGHLTHAIDNATRQLGGTVDRAESWAEQFGGGSTPTNDRSDYPSRDELITAYTGAAETLRNAVRAAEPSVFDQPVENERIRAFFPTVGRWLTHVLMCECSFHAGQLSAWRKARAMPSVFDNEANVNRLMTAV